MRHPVMRVLRADALLLADASQQTCWMRIQDAGIPRDNVRGIYRGVRDEHPEALLRQQRHRSFTYIINGETIFTHHHVTWRRRAIAVHAQHITAIADIAMPALRRTRFDGKPRLFNKQKAKMGAQEAWTCKSDAIRAATGWASRRDVASGVRETLDWYRREKWI